MNQTSYRTKWIIGGFVCMYGLGIQPLVPQVKAAPVEAASVDQRLREALSRPAVEGLALSPVSLRAAMTLQRLLTQPDFSLPADLPEAELTYALTFHRELLRDRSLTLAAPAPDRPSGGRTTAQVRTELAKLWLARHGEALAAEALTTEALAAEALTTEDTGRPLVQSLATNARLLLGDYLSSQQDGRCVPLYRACFEQWEREHTDGGGVIQKINGSVPGVHPLAWYYQARGEWKAAAQAYLRSEKYSTSHVWVASALVEAARAYNKCGETAAAQMTYAKVANYPKGGWATGMAVCDQAYGLMDQEKYQEAEQALASALPHLGAKSEKFAVALMLGYAQYRACKWDVAEHTLSHWVAQSQDKAALQEGGLWKKSAFAHELLRWTGIWKKTPLVCEPEQLRIVVRQGAPARPLQFSVCSATKTEIAVSSENPRLQIEVKHDDLNRIQPYYVQTTVEVRPTEIRHPGNFQTVLYITSSQSKDFVLKLPIDVVVEPEVRLSKTAAFFGTVKRGSKASCQIELTSPVAVRLGRQIDENAPVVAEFDTQKETAQHSVQLQLSDDLPAGWHQGAIHLEVISGEKSTIEIPYIVRID